MTKNNLFNYATSELSQDAFLCWLISFAYEDVQSDMELKECAKELICTFAPDLKDSTFELKNIQRQYKHIDILLTIMAAGKEYKVIIEDKVFTNEHDDQLERYRNDICEEFKRSEVRCAYYITGFQSDTSNVEKAGYTIVDRRQMLDLMARCKTDNRIFLDYFEYWHNFEEESKLFDKMPVEKWEWKQVYGCFEQLADTIRKEGGWAEYGYVANRGGGFDGLWFGLQDNRIMVDNLPYELYLQLNFVIGNPTTAKLYLKMSEKNDDTKEKTAGTEARTKARDNLIYDENAKYKLESFHFNKPQKPRDGESMTIGIYNNDAESDEEIFTDYCKLKSVLAHAFEDYKRLLKEKQCTYILPKGGLSDANPI